MWLYFLGIAKTSCSSFILPQEAFFFHCLLLLERFKRERPGSVFLCFQAGPFPARGGGRSAAAVAGAAVAAAVVAAVVMLAVVVAMDVGLVVQAARQQGVHRRVGRAGGPAVQPDARGGQGGLGAAADAAADQNVGPQLLQDAGHGAVALAAGAHHLAAEDLPVFHIVDFELFGTAEMLEDLAVCVGDCNSHGIASFLWGPGEGAGSLLPIVARCGPECQSRGRKRAKTARLPCRVAQRDRGNSLFDGTLPLCYNRSSLKNGIFYAVSLKNVRRYKEMADRRSTIEDVAKRA